jgi:hypothetical protein
LRPKAAARWPCPIDTAGLTELAEARKPRGGHIAAGSLRSACGVSVPSIPEVGSLLSYRNDQTDNYRRAAVYVDRILRGATPSELPVQARVKFELVINLNTAKALRLDVPLHLQQLADQQIE